MASEYFDDIDNWIKKVNDDTAATSDKEILEGNGNGKAKAEAQKKIKAQKKSITFDNKQYQPKNRQKDSV